MNHPSNLIWFLAGPAKILSPMLKEGINLEIDNVTVGDSSYIVIRGHKADIKNLSSQIQGDQGHSVCHLMDKAYFVSEHGDIRQSGQAFFEAIAFEYENLISPERNIECAQTLYNAALERIHLQSAPNVLDFGCGTGLSAHALIKLNPEVTAYDYCPNMRSLARKSGLKVAETLEELKPAKFNIVICCYVMHFGIHKYDASHIFDTMVSGGILAANFHKGISITSTKELLLSSGFFFLEEIQKENNIFGPILLFQRD